MYGSQAKNLRMTIPLIWILRCQLKLEQRHAGYLSLFLDVFYHITSPWILFIWNMMTLLHCVKSVRIRSYSGPHFPAFKMNTERYSVSLCFQSNCGKMWTRITPNTDTLCTVLIFTLLNIWKSIWYFIRGEVNGEIYQRRFSKYPLRGYFLPLCIALS